jgi:transcriptional regulator GlxA family with amidase domain
MTQRLVVIVAYPGFVLLDLAGPCEVFRTANRIWRDLHPVGEAPYRVRICSVNSELRVLSAGAVALLADAPIADGGAVDTLLVPGGVALDALTGEEALGWLRQMAPHVRRIGSVCTGAFLLAAAGLLEGRAATTHWQHCRQLTAQYPGIRVDHDSIYVRDGNVYTSAGATAGMDLAVALVEEDLGHHVAMKVAQSLVMFVRRPGGQSQFGCLLDAPQAERQPLRELNGWMAENVSGDLAVGTLAARVHMSTRNFSRIFRRELGKTPARYTEALRVERARRMLEETGERLEHIARECGLGSGNSMLRSFVRVLGVPPSQYRERFRRDAVIPE